MRAFVQLCLLEFSVRAIPYAFQTMLLLAVDTDVSVYVELVVFREDVDWNQWNCLLSNITTLCTRVTERHGHWEPWVDQQRSP